MCMEKTPLVIISTGGVYISRTARKESKTGYYHVITPGNNRNCIFSKERYKFEFINLL
jgi:hypothetical protein